MHIALASFEYTSGGGIGTYIQNAAAMLSSRGHDVEVFTSSECPKSADSDSKFQVHRVTCTRENFREEIVPLFAERHRTQPFDLVEGPEYKADAAGIARAFPDLPLVVRVHGPTFTIDESNANYIPWHARLRYYAGALRRGRLPDNPWRYVAENDSERAHALAAHEVMANSQATANRIRQVWGLAPDRLSVVPLAFRAPHPLPNLNSVGGQASVLFLGRLEVRKGVLELAKAIPYVRRRIPSAKFSFVGRVLPHPQDRRPLDEHILRIVGQHRESVEMTGPVAYSDVPRFLQAADICVFPSDWEASGFVCLEAMAAGRAVIGSEAGGMAEIIERGRTGMLVPPRDPKAIANAILELLADPHKRTLMGEAARAQVMCAYTAETIGPLQEAGYRRAIAHAKARNQSGALANAN